jgi:glycosyltransferase involved in cell wall biosynthesis
MIGPSIDSLGGMATVQRIILENWQSSAYSLVHLPSQKEGSKALKLAVAVRAVGTLLTMLAFGQISAIHVHFALGTSFYRKSLFALLGCAFRVPVIGHAHAGAFPSFYGSCGPIRRWYIRAVLNCMQHIITLSQDCCAFYSTLHRRDASTMIPNPVPVPAVVASLASTTKAPVLLTLGKLGHDKGTYDILDIVPAVLARFPRAEFWFGGDGEVEEVRQFIAGQPWAGQVHLLGWLSGAEKDNALQAARLFLLPSYAEGMPMALLEAMAFGLPVIATSVGGIPEAVIAGETGLLIEPGDRDALLKDILDLLDAPDRAAALGTAARVLVTRRFAVSTVLADITSVYDAATGRIPIRSRAHLEF